MRTTTIGLSSRQSAKRSLSMGAWFLAPDTSIHCVNNGLPHTALARTASGREVEDCCIAHQLFVGVHKLPLQMAIVRKQFNVYKHGCSQRTSP